MKVLACALLLVGLSAVAHAANYAVLVAGSNGYYNYRHQSDVCHAFHVLTNSSEGAFPKENVIVFMYDDIANNSQNPVQGNIINHPDGVNVYPGVNKDYTGAAVTPQNFLAAITGNTSATGPVLKSGPDDNVFIYFTDHGAPGLIAFPSDYLYANDLIAALQTMHTKNMYKNLVFYLEACESGSMFDGLLPADIGIFATTAANPTESSYACYWDQTRQAYLGDEYSVRWMEDSDVHDHAGSSETLEQQFDVVVNETLQSHPQQYGDQPLSSDPITAFQADFKSNSVPATTTTTTQPRAVPTYTPCGDQADSRDVKIQVLMHQLRAATRSSEMLRLGAEVQQELAARAQADLVFDTIVSQVAGPSQRSFIKGMRSSPRNFACLKSSVSAVESACGRFTDYSLKYVYLLVNMCEQGHTADEIAQAAVVACQ